MAVIMCSPTLGDEMVLQYSNYDKIALGQQAQFIEFAVKYANKATFIDTDFVTSQAVLQKISRP